MRERLTTLACALGALLAFGALFVRTGPPGAREAASPTTAEAHGNGLLGLMTWLREEGVPVLSLRERFGVLATRPDLPHTGNLLIVMLPAARAYRTDEAVALERWIRAGNTLLVLAALSDRPDWARSERNLMSDLPLLTGLDMQLIPAEAAPNPGPGSAAAPAAAPAPEKPVAQRARELIPLVPPQRNVLLPNRPHPYLEGVERAVALSDYPPLGSALKLPRDGFVLALAHEADGHQGLLWERPLGAGTLIVSGFASLFTNRALGLADNARLFANIVAAQRHGAGLVIFDDQHQGLSRIYDPEKFYRDGRLYATLGIIAGVWLAWVLGGTRLRAAPVHSAAPREAQLVRDTGLYLARVLRPAAAARRMIDNFLRRAGPPGAAAQGSPWQTLENHPRLAAADVAQLRRWHEAAAAGARVPLPGLRNLIVKIERQLTA